MYRVSDFKKSIYRTGEVAKILGVTPKTIQNYDKEGRLKFCRTEGNRRIVLREDLIKFLKEKEIICDDVEEGRCDVIYARVSSHDQKSHGDLDRQVLYLIESGKDFRNPVILKEVGSGLNDNRKQLQKLLHMVGNHEVRKVYITYKDRLTRFGYHYLETMFQFCGTEIVIVQDEKEKSSVEEELVEDMMSLIASFSGKLYGMRSRKNRPEEGQKREKSRKA